MNVMENLFSQLRAVGFRTIREDLRYLQSVGHWKDGVVPDWASLVAKTLHCVAGSGAVTSIAWEFVAEEAVAELDRLNAAATALDDTDRLVIVPL